MTGQPIVPFQISISDEMLADVSRRLEMTRLPEAELVDDWSQGMPLAYVKELVDYWANEYDWRSREALLNQIDQFTTEIDGLTIHFVHSRSGKSDATPILMSHGWPGSFVEFAKVIGPLNEAGFHVVCPSIPGFGFSGKPTETGWGVEKVAEVWAKLMDRLGYGSYLAQGGDWGSAITASVAYQDLDHCVGAHMTLAMGSPPVPDSDGNWTEEDQLALDKLKYYVEHGAGYSGQQSTRPQTIGYALADSPVGQMAWIVEKFWEWTDCDGHPENVITRDELLDNVMFYWATNSATSSARIYWESFGGGKIKTGEVTIPTGFTAYPEEIIPPVRRWCEAGFTDIVYWNTQPRGGHFAALEVPELFVADIVAFAEAVL